LRHICRVDNEYPSEQINSLYFDTADLDQHNKSLSGDFRKDKVRIRWYGMENNLSGPVIAFLELKSRQGFSSTKQRLQLQIPADAVSKNSLVEGVVSRTLLMDTLAGFGYFPPEPIHPIIKISYWRYRFRDLSSGQSIALDSKIRSSMIASGIGYGENELDLAGGVIEVKGINVELPLTLKQMKLLDLDWSRFSKYSACIDSHMDDIGSVGRMSPSGKILDY